MRKALVLIAATFAVTSQTMAQENRRYSPRSPGYDPGPGSSYGYYPGYRSPYPGGAETYRPPLTLRGPNGEYRGSIYQDPIFRDSYTVYDRDGRAGTIRKRKY